MDQIYDNSMLVNEFSPEEGITETEFRNSIENVFSYRGEYL